MWYQGHLDLDNQINFKQFEYTKKPLKQSQIDRWQKLGHEYKSFNGAMFADQSCMPKQCYDIAKDLGFIQPGFTFYKMSTGEVMPDHVDHFDNYCKNFKVDRQYVYRAAVFLEDWKKGHYFEIDGCPIVNWKKGDYVVWSEEEFHTAANIGSEDRFTLQITGQLA
mgnify:CR=1 FL=1